MKQPPAAKHVAATQSAPASLFIPTSPVHFTVTTRLGLISSAESSRYSINAVLVTPASDKTVYLAVTDGRGLIVTEAIGQASSPVLVPIAAFPTRMKGDVTIRWNADQQVWDVTPPRGKPGFAVQPLPEDSNPFPADHTLLQDLTPLAEDDFVGVVLNAEILAKMQAAMGTDTEHRGITLLINRHPRKLGSTVSMGSSGWVNRVVLAADVDGIGAVMPMAPAHEEKNVAIEIFQKFSASYVAARSRFAPQTETGPSVAKVVAAPAPKAAPIPRISPAPKPIAAPRPIASSPVIARIGPVPPAAVRRVASF